MHPAARCASRPRALWIVTGIIVLGAAIVVMLLLGRVVRRPAGEARTLASLGLRSRDLALERVCEALCCTAVAVPGAVGVVRLDHGAVPARRAPSVRAASRRRSSTGPSSASGALALLVVAIGVPS